MISFVVLGICKASEETIMYQAGRATHDASGWIYIKRNAVRVGCMNLKKCYVHENN